MTACPNDPTFPVFVPDDPVNLWSPPPAPPADHEEDT